MCVQAVTRELVRPAGQAIKDKAEPLTQAAVDVAAAPAKQLARDAVPLTEQATREVWIRASVCVGVIC